MQRKIDGFRRGSQANQQGRENKPSAPNPRSPSPSSSRLKLSSDTSESEATDNEKEDENAFPAEEEIAPVRSENPAAAGSKQPNQNRSNLLHLFIFLF